MDPSRLRGVAESIRLPRPPLPEISPLGFLLCPMTGALWLGQQLLYRCAFEQALAVVRPSLPERDLVAVWN
jgi:hypothetical protein